MVTDVDMTVAEAAVKAELDAAIAHNDDALDNPRADRPAARQRLALAWQAAHEMGLI